MSLLAHIKSLSKESLIYGIGGTLTSLVSFLLIPLYTHYLVPADYGYLNIFIAYQAVVEITAVFALSSAMFRYYLITTDVREKNAAFNTCFWTQVVSIFMVAVLILPFTDSLSQALFESTAQKYNIFLVTTTALAGACTTFGLSFLRANNKAGLFIVLQILKASLIATLNIYFVAYLKLDYYGIIVSNLIVTALICVIILSILAKHIRPLFSLSYFKKIITFSAPIFLINVLFFLLNLSDRFLLNYFGSADDVGLYSFGSKIGSIVTLAVIAPFSTAVLPYALSIAHEPDFKHTFSKINKYFTIIITYLSLAIFMFSKELIMLISTSEYYSAVGIIGPILLSGIFFGLYYNLSIALDIVEKTYLYVYIVFGGAVVNIAANVVLIPIMGFYGSAIASSLSSAVLFLLMFIFCQRNFPVPYESKAFLKLLLLTLLYALVLLLISNNIESTILNIITKGSMLMLFPLLIYKIGILDERELKFIQKKLYKRSAE